MTLDPISIATAGYVCGEGPDPIAIGTLGYVCEGEVAVRGGDPEGAWEKARRQFERFRRQRREAHVSHETPVSPTEHLDELDRIIEEIEAELAALRESELAQLDLAELSAAFAERQRFTELTDEAIDRDTVIYLEAYRRQMREDELAFNLEVARQLRVRLQNNLAVATATVAILFPTKL